jgi:serine protease AprX
VSQLSVERKELSYWLFNVAGTRRYTQDSPVLPGVWYAFGENPQSKRDLLLTPHARSTAAQLVRALRESLTDPVSARLAYNETYVVVSVDFPELVRELLPLSEWWRRVWPPRTEQLGAWVARHAQTIAEDLIQSPERETEPSKAPYDLRWLVGVVGRIALEREPDPGAPPPAPESTSAADLRQLVSRASAMLSGLEPPNDSGPLPLWSVNLNRTAQTALWKSRRSIKADAAERVFEPTCSHLRWAVIDSGVDATHPAFRRRDDKGHLVAKPFPGTGSGTRVVATYDFTKLRDLIARGGDEVTADINRRLDRGQDIDWDTIAPQLRVEHESRKYVVPSCDHGTHVAGIIGAHWRADEPDMPVLNDLRGICPDIELYDLRVLDESGRGDEYAITAALQFVRHLNAHSDLQVIHGVNLSLSLTADVEHYAVGRTPVCDECERLVSNSVVVVVAAGNEGRSDYTSESGTTQGFRTVSITDPGNAETVITVGSTHRLEPHTYGVSYFSSRGPTGDGRAKPDVVAPGEKINSAVPGPGIQVKDGTSQAAPHVSGAAALLMARHEELLGQPARIKNILCSTATDLGREHYFQGTGLIDVLRAMQAV